MTRKIPVQPAGAPAAGGPYTPGIIAGDFVFVSGQIPKNPETNELVAADIAAQTRQVLANVKCVVEAAGCTMADVVKVNAYLVDPADRATFNEVYAEHFPQPYPTRTTVFAGLGPGIKVEIDVMAIRPATEGGAGR